MARVASGRMVGLPLGFDRLGFDLEDVGIGVERVGRVGGVGIPIAVRLGIRLGEEGFVHHRQRRLDGHLHGSLLLDGASTRPG